MQVWCSNFSYPNLSRDIQVLISFPELSWAIPIYVSYQDIPGYPDLPRVSLVTMTPGSRM